MYNVFMTYLLLYYFI